MTDAWKTPMHSHAATARYSVLAAVLALLAVTAAWDARPARSLRPTLLYVGAADCAPCRSWQAGDGADFLSSPEFARVSYRAVTSPTLRGLLDDENWPADLRVYRDRLGREAGVPLWMLVGEGEVLARGFGASQWRSLILPRIKALMR
jgi:hypothetical protein